MQTAGFFRSIGIDEEGRLVLAGSNNIQRYTDGGEPDTTFAPQGRLILADTSIHTLLLDANDRILIAGHTTASSSTGADFLIARYITTGMTVTVRNVPPQDLAISGPATAPEGSTIQLVGSATDPGIDDVLTYTWTVTRDGNPYTEASGQTVSSGQNWFVVCFCPTATQPA